MRTRRTLLLVCLAQLYFCTSDRRQLINEADESSTNDSNAPTNSPTTTAPTAASTTTTPSNLNSSLEPASKSDVGNSPGSDPLNTCGKRVGVDPICEAIVGKVVPGSETAIAGQMVMMQLNQMLNGTELMPNKAKSFARQNIGSIFDSPGRVIDKKFNFNVTQWRDLYTQIQKAFKELNADPVLFALDSVHGANYVADAVILPAQINMGATFNTELIYKAGVVAGEETLAAGAPLLFSPILDIAIEKNWARIQETFGESSFLVAELGAAFVKGVQSTNKTSACIKHFAAYSLNRGGFDRSNVDVNFFEFKNKFLLPYKKAIEAGAKCVMESYISINRSPVISSTVLLNDILRDVLQFKGLLVSDFKEVNNLVDWHHTSDTVYNASKLALKTSLDMNMEAWTTEYIVDVYNAYKANEVTKERLEESYKRIKTLKTELGLYEELIPGAEYLKNFRSKEHIQTGLDIARESMILYKNNNSILPLKKKTKIFLTGPGANDIGLQCGAWSIEWQGIKEANEDFPHGVSFEAGLKAMGGNVVSVPGIYVNGTKIPGHKNVKKLAEDADVIIMTLAEQPGTEKPADEYDLKFNSEQLQYARDLLKTGKPMILALLINRPRLLDGLVDEVDAVLNTMLPCEMGGQAFAEIIYGVISPSGKSPYTYPAYQSVSDVTFDEPIDDKCVGYQRCATQFDFGTGLSYVNMTYGPITLSSTQIGKDDILTVSVEITNNGSMAAKEAVLLYLIQPVRAIATPEYQTLQGFQKIELQPGASQVVKFKLNSEAWTVFGPDTINNFERKFEQTKFFVTFEAFTDCNDESPETDCASFSVA